METYSMIKGPNKYNPEFPLNSSPTFLKHKDVGVLSAPQLEVSGIEMMVMPTVSYTSLRDIMPHPHPHPHPHPNNASWHEIPIKNPLLKQAALAYLQPMSTPPEIGNKGFFEKLKEKCFCDCDCHFDFGCFRWLVGGVFNTLLEAFVGCFCERRRSIRNGEQEDQQHQDEDDVDVVEGR